VWPQFHNSDSWLLRCNAASFGQRNSATNRRLGAYNFVLAVIWGLQHRDRACRTGVLVRHLPLSRASGPAHALQNKVRVRDTEDIFPNVWFDFIEVLSRQFQVLVLRSNISSAVARQ